jgi:hypothetical protein
MSLYLKHNGMFRSRLAANTTWSDDRSDFTVAGFEYNLDIGLLSYFRRYVFRDLNTEKSQRLTFRLGYAYIGDLVSGNPQSDEKRGIGEVTIRFPLGKAWLLSDRNRGELRNVNDEEFGRYRNRLRIERNVAISKFRVTPYTSGEAFYDGKEDDWNQAEAVLGAEFPFRFRTVLELSFTWQYLENSTDNQILGLTLQKHL